MRLSTRLTRFFLGALALVLVAFSASLFVLAAKYLSRQADERLEAALNTLAAAAEVNERGVEWEPQERTLSFGRRTVEGSFAWRITDDHGRPIDASLNAQAVLRGTTPVERPTHHPRNITDPAGTPWRLAVRRLESPVRTAQGDAARGFHEALVLSAAVSLEGLHETLRNLAIVLAGLSTAVWTLALVCGERFCRRVLRPVAAMATAAHDIGGDEPGRRLPVPEVDDELGELGRSFNDLLDRLHESFERQRRFTGDASHQLRTPLTALQGHVDLVLRQERSPEEYRRVLTLVQRRTRHLRQIVESLLFLARADAEAGRPDLEPIELAGWVEEHLRTWHDPRRAADVRLEVEANAPLWVTAHASLLGELVNNLLDNAAKYSEPGTPIVVRLSHSPPDILLAVDDRGVGIAPDELPSLFDPFYRSESARRRSVGGLGLGLSVAQRLAKLFGGSIGVESEPGQGSTFLLRLPARATAPAGPPADSSPLRQPAVLSRDDQNA